MYIKKKDRELFHKLDEYLILPKDFKQYIKQKELNHRLIIKNKKEYKCTNCSYAFNSNLKVNDKCMCPSCKREYLIKSKSLSHYEFKEWFCILDRYEDLWIVRRFELITWYSNGNYSNDLCEYGRHIYDKYLKQIYEIFNQNVSCCINGKFVNHYHSTDTPKWSVGGSYYHSLSEYSILYPGNVKELLKDTKWKYCELWTFAEHCDFGIDVMRALYNMNNQFEILVKQGLYSLAADLIDDYFNKKVDSKELLNLIKQHIEFIRKYDLNYNELMILKNIKYYDIDIIRKYSTFVQSDRLLENIDLKLAYKLTDLSSKNCYEYGDYIEFIKKLKLNLKDKKILYPANIKEAHDNAEKQIEVLKNKKFDSAIRKKYKKLIKNKFQDKKYIVFPAMNVEELVDESSQQNNCVRTYAERIAKNDCDIYFMRLVDSQDKSLVTVEVRNNKVCQQRIKNNEQTSKEQQRFLKKWEKLVLNS